MSSEQKRREILISETPLPVPAAVVQALYHATTGKTENLTKRLTKNYIVRRNDLDQLYLKICQQLEHYEVVAGPTVTITVRFHNGERHQFSSWPRFKLFDCGKSELVDDIIIKFEFVIKIPASDVLQRYILTIDVDSKLPVISEQEPGSGTALKFMLFSLEDIPSLVVSVDYIDYICAKIIYVQKISLKWSKTGLSLLRNLRVPNGSHSCGAHLCRGNLCSVASEMLAQQYLSRSTLT